MPRFVYLHTHSFSSLSCYDLVEIAGSILDEKGFVEIKFFFVGMHIQGNLSLSEPATSSNGWLKEGSLIGNYPGGRFWGRGGGG